MRFRLVLRKERAARAVLTGVAASVFFSLVVPVPGAAATTFQYRDEFSTETFTGSDGLDAWAGPWIEEGEASGADPGDGAIEIKSEGFCHTDACLVLGKGDHVDATIKRAFSSTGASSVTLTFDYERHVHGAGAGEVQILASADGSSWSLVARYALDIDDGGQQAATHNLSVASAGSMIRFALVGNTDDSHMNVDNLQITVISSSPPVFDQDLGNRTDGVGDSVSIDAGATDPDSINLVYAATGLPTGISIEPTTGLISGTIDAAAVTGSPHDVKVVVTDPDDNGDLDTFTWTIIKPNAPPTASDRSATVDQDDPGGVSIWLLDPAFVSDPDGDTVTLSGFDPTTGDGTVSDLGGGWVKYVPNGGFSGTDSFGYEITDGVGGFVSATVTVTVVPVAATTTTTTTTTTVTVPPTTTTTTTPSTTTTTAVTVPPTKPPSWTPTPPASAPATTAPEPTTTTSEPVPSTTTTTLVATAPPPQATTTTTTVPRAEITREEAQVLKNDLVRVSSSPEVGGVAVAGPQRDHELDPLEGLTVTFGSAVETLQTHLLSSIVLGVVLAALLMLGVEEKEKSRSAGAT